MKNTVTLLVLIALNFYCFAIYAQGNFSLKTIGGSNAVFALEIVQSGNQETIKISREGGNPTSAQSTIPFVGDYGFAPFRDICKIILQSNWAGSGDEAIDFTTQIDHLENQLSRAFDTWQAKKIENTVRLLSIDEPAGILKVSSKKVPLYNLEWASKKKEDYEDAKKEYEDAKKAKNAAPGDAKIIEAEVNAKKAVDAAEKNYNDAEKNTPNCSNSYTQTYQKGAIDKADGKFMELHDLSFTISDNFIYRCTIEGVIDGKEKTISNDGWSLSLKSRDGQRMVLNIDNQEYMFCYNDVFAYQSYPATGALSYYVQDDEFNLKPGEEKVLNKKSLDEYLGINISSDFLGINTGNSSNLLTTDFNAILPLNILQQKRLRLFNHASIRLAFTVLNGANGNNDFRNLYNTNDSLFVDVFDLLRYQNINLDLYQSFLGVELKQINTVFHVSAGIDFYRSGLRLVKEAPELDTIKEFNVWSSAPYFKIFAQYRPDLRFGADFQYEIKGLKLNNLSNDNPFFYLSDGIDREHKNQFKPLADNRCIVNSFELDLYGQMGRKSGIFARLGIDAVGFGSNDNVFPRITVGYSTNLDAYINSVKKQKG